MTTREEKNIISLYIYHAYKSYLLYTTLNTLGQPLNI